MFGKHFYRMALAGLGTFLAGTLLAAPVALAAGRYNEKPPVILSPDLTEPWQLQLSSRRRAKVVVRSSRSFSQPKRQVRRKAVRKKRAAYRTAARSTRATLRRDKRKPRRTTPQRRQTLARNFLPQIVEYNTSQKPGTIIIDTNTRYLYLVMANGEARRYGVGVGKPGFEWAGAHKVTRKAEWPSWRPPAEMIAREKKKGRDLPTFVAGGPENPLGARALYLGSTLYRIHGTNAPWTIGQAVSSGCIRMRNQDVRDLYPRVSLGSKVVVL